MKYVKSILRIIFIASLGSFCLNLIMQEVSDAKERRIEILVTQCESLFNKTVADNPSGFEVVINTTTINQENIAFISYSYLHTNTGMRLTFCGISGDTVVLNPNKETLNMLLGKK